MALRTPNSLPLTEAFYYILLSLYAGPAHGYAIITLATGYTAFTSIPYTITKRYQGAIYLGNHVVKKVPVSLIGKVYRGVFRSNEFIGTVHIGGAHYVIQTPRQARTFSHENVKVPYPYLGMDSAVIDNRTEITASIGLSAHFDTIAASTSAISKEYGKRAELFASTK